MRHLSTSSQKGVTLIELAIAALVMGLVVMSSLYVFRVLNKGLMMSKSSLRANTLMLSKLEDLRNDAMTAAYNSQWSSVTYTTLSSAYHVTTTTSIDGVPFTWAVYSKYVAVNGTVTADSLGTSTNMIALTGILQYKSVYGARTITRTAYVANYGR
jgi:Tfp pilus assembly protein PilE